MAIPTFVDVPDTDINVGSPTKSPTAFAFRDNLLSALQFDSSRLPSQPVVCEGAFDPGAIQNADIGTAQVDARCISGAFGQSQVKSSTGSISQLTSGTEHYDLVLPGGYYGFWPNVYCSGSGGSSTVSTSLASTVELITAYQANVSVDSNGSGSRTTYWNQLYIIASPPYDLGDGEIPLFVYAEVDETGKVLATYAAQDPPWHVLNKPPVPITTTTPGKVINVKGKITKSKDIKTTTWMQPVDYNYPSTVTTAAQRSAYRKANPATPIAVTTAGKNTSMAKLPHPFLGKRKRIVLLDPVSTADLAEVHQHESVSELLHSGDIIIDPTALKRATPPGVDAVSWKWR